jgi:hypothetical protein
MAEYVGNVHEDNATLLAINRENNAIITDLETNMSFLEVTKSYILDTDHRYSVYNSLLSRYFIRPRLEQN